MMERALEGRVVVLTGADGGIGRAAATRLAQDGARLVLSDREARVAEVAADLEAAGAEAIAVVADVTSADDIRGLADAAKERFGGVDALVNNHGAIVGRPFLETTEADWDRVHSIVLRSVFFVSQAIVPLMIGREAPSIVNVASVGGMAALPAMSAYGAAKAGVIHLSRGMALDLAEYGIRVNAISPGVIDTPQPRQFVSTLEDPQAAFDAFAPMHILGRVGTADEVADAIAYLASARSTFTTGSNLVVDGGMTAI
jgi:NAD(P)-dependent dehydrogenase (short-subunit alcohol dehydrogenase family)